MPVVFTFDLTEYQPGDHKRLRSAFERLGWESLGGTAYRYPRLRPNRPPIEDWFNHVLPALMLFRSYVQSNPGRLTRFTLDVQSSTGYDSASGYGTPPNKGASVRFYSPGTRQFGLKNLQKWIDGITYPY